MARSLDDAAKVKKGRERKKDRRRRERQKEGRGEEREGAGRTTLFLQNI